MPVLTEPLKLLTLVMNQTGLTSLEQIAASPNLTHLEILGNPIPASQIPLLRNLTRLGALIAANLGLTEVDFLRSMPHLTLLSLDGNPIENWAGLSASVQMVFLSVNNTPLRDLSIVEPLSRLEHLDAAGSGIIDASGAESLTTLIGLRLQQNKISDFSFLGSLGFLQQANLSQNNAFVVPGTSSRMAIDAAIARGAIVSFLPQTVSSFRVGIDSALRVHVQGPDGGTPSLQERVSFDDPWVTSTFFPSFTGYSEFVPNSAAPAKVFRSASQ